MIIGPFSWEKQQFIINKIKRKILVEGLKNKSDIQNANTYLN